MSSSSYTYYKGPRNTTYAYNLTNNLQAMKNISKLSSQNIYTNLFPIAIWNKQLQTKTFNDKVHALAVTLSSDPTIVSPIPGDQPKNPQDFAWVFEGVWVVMWPEPLLWAKKQDQATITPERLSQLLGLSAGTACNKPNAVSYCEKYAHFLWVPLDKLVRPCKDPEIDDFECRFENYQASLPIGSNPYWETQVYTHRQESIQQIDQNTGGYPFTGLGYTYDWATMGPGLSEYIVLPGTEVIPDKTLSMDQYVNLLKNKNL